MPRSKNDRTPILVSLLDGPATTSDLGVSAYIRNSLIEDNLVAAKGTQKHGTEGAFTRGRPSLILGLTSKGRKRAKRATA